MSEPRELMGVILAAGKGTRMYPFSLRYPKPLLPVLGKSLLVHQVEMLAAVGIRDIVLVIGHLGHEVLRELGDGSVYGVRIEYVEQEETLGIAHALSQLESHVNRPFFLLLGDIFFEFKSGAGLEEMVDALFSDRNTKGVLAVCEESSPEAIKRNFIVLCDDGRVTRVIEKPRHPQVNVKGCGAYLFDVAIFDSVRRTPRTAMRDEYEITDSIQIFIDDGYRVEAADIVARDLNLSYATDLLDINLYVLDRTGETCFCGHDVEVHPDADLERCVVMDRAKIGSGVRLRDCLVFPDVRLHDDHDRTRHIFTTEQWIQL